MKTKTLILIAAILISAGYCIKAQKSAKLPELEVYKPGYEPGTNKNLIFTGYYNNAVEVLYNNMFVDKLKDKSDLVQPLFFFEDGSFCADFIGMKKSRLDEIRNTTKSNYLVLDSLPATPSVKVEHSWAWGNYKIVGNEILMESLHFATGFTKGKYEKLIEKGIIYQDSICIFETSINYYPKRTIKFNPYNLKPDSSLNWIRKEEAFNKKGKK